MSTAKSTLEAQDPDSLEERSGSLGEAEETPSESAAPPEDDAAAVEEADTAGQPDDGEAAPAPAEVAAEAEPGKDEPETPSPPIADASPPFSFRVDGQVVEVDGATEADGKITLSREAWDRVVLPRVVDRGRMAARDEAAQRRIQSLEGDAEAREDRFKAVLGKVDALFSDPAKGKAFFDAYQTEAPRFKLEIENELLKTERKQQATQVETSAKQAEEREFNERARPALKSAIDRVLDETAKGLTLDRSELENELWGLWEADVPVFFRVQPDDGSGLDPKEHKFGVDTGRVARILSPFVKAAQQSAAAKKAEEVRKANAQALKGGEKAPPTVPASGSPTPGGEAREFKTAEEFNAYMAEKYKVPMASSH
jgi:hypothetical protein